MSVDDTAVGLLAEPVSEDRQVSAEIQGDPLSVRPTHPPAARLTSRELWDEAERPTGPGAPADHVYGPLSQQIGQHLVDVHDHLRGELDRVRELIEQVRRGAAQAAAVRSAINDMTMRQNNWTLGAYCASYCRLVSEHHGLEDAAVFPHLRQQDPDLVPVIDRLQQEHVVIHGILEGLDRALVDYIRDPSDFTALREAVDVLTDGLLSHLSYEEHQLVEPLARLGFFAGQF
jgi:iron-sulfur cluster repair protein YtfE (RIC family)